MKISLLNLDIILMTKMKEKMKMIIYDLECPQCKKRANLDVVEMGFKKDTDGN